MAHGRPFAGLTGPGRPGGGTGPALTAARPGGGGRAAAGPATSAPGRSAPAVLRCRDSGPGGAATPLRPAPAPCAAGLRPAGLGAGLGGLGCRFVTADPALRSDGVPRVVEAGAGQVSDLPPGAAGTAPRWAAVPRPRPGLGYPVRTVLTSGSVQWGTGAVPWRHARTQH
ncbi:ATP-grasp domain-containing protein [Streptomyces xinghaiensis]|uniref:ATP-grasp domain-containing protein n=1 Tax=Streptomyces xinghaiensis TaxID=1038928 RepID=UPI003421674E